MQNYHSDSGKTSITLCKRANCAYTFTAGCFELINTGKNNS